MPTTSLPRELTELGFYLLGGQAQDPAPLLREAPRGEELGLGAAFLSERWNTKEIGSRSGRPRPGAVG